jgi:hypothetical protein
MAAMRGSQFVIVAENTIRLAAQCVPRASSSIANVVALVL